MDISNIPVAIAICHELKIPLMMWGATGLGKSTVVADFCKNNYHFKDGDEPKIPYGFCDLRTSQMENTDIRGLPSKDVDEGTVKYLVPDELPRFNYVDKDGKLSNVKSDDNTLYNGILFLDEPNRAEDDVLQSLFQLIYDRKVGNYSIPDGWAIVGAGNHANKNYNVNQFFKDAAMLDRWIHITVESSNDYYKSWTEYILSKDYDNDIMTKVLQYTSTNPENFAQRDKPDDLHITPSPRSWERVIKLEHVMKKYIGVLDDVTYKSIYAELVSGIIGMSAYQQYVAFKVEISPLEIFNNGLDAKNEQKLKNILFDKNMEILQTGPGRSVLQSICFGMVSYAKREIEPSEKKIRNVLEFGKWVFNVGNQQFRDIGFGYFVSLLKGEYTESSTITGILVNSSLKNLIRKNANKSGKSRTWVDALLSDPVTSKIIEETSIIRRESKYELDK